MEASEFLSRKMEEQQSRASLVSANPDAVGLLVEEKRTRKRVDRDELDNYNIYSVVRKSKPADHHSNGNKAKIRNGGRGNATNISNTSKQSKINKLDQQLRFFETTSLQEQPMRRVLINSVVLSSLDRAPQLQVSEDLLECTGCEGGYRMIRASHGVHNGAYFWEAEVLPPLSDNAHIRIGWSTRQGDLQAPVGYDKFSYGYRDIDGSKVHDSIRNDNYGASYGEGDIIGCYINLNDREPSYNQIRFFKNGVDQGQAYRGKEIPQGVIFPAISLYRQARVRVNFGPTFIIKPEIHGANAVSEVQPMNPEDRKVSIVPSIGPFNQTTM